MKNEQNQYRIARFKRSQTDKCLTIRSIANNNKRKSNVVYSNKRQILTLNRHISTVAWTCLQALSLNMTKSVTAQHKHNSFSFCLEGNLYTDLTEHLDKWHPFRRTGTAGLSGSPISSFSDFDGVIKAMKADAD